MAVTGDGGEPDAGAAGAGANAGAGSGSGDDEMTRFVTEALVSVESEPAPPRLRGRVLEAALARRPAGRPAPGADGEPLSPVESYRRTVAELGELLDGLDAAAWSAEVAPYAPQGWTVQGLVGHLLAVERLLAARLGVGDVPAGADDDHIAMSLDVAAAQVGRAPEETLSDWRAAVHVVLDALAASPPELGERVPFHGVEFRWWSLLVARTLEVWTHADDIRRAVGQPPATPDAGRLSLLTDLAVRTLPLRLATTGTYTGTVRMVLTGPGGGAWSQPLAVGSTSPEPGEPDVRLVADAVAFCRLTAGRIDAAELEATITGDTALGAAILASSAAFAL